MDFKSWSTERASHFELCAKKALPPDNRLPWKLHEAMRYAVLDGGKRIRPLLAYAAGELVGAKEEALDHIALALEYIHSYSLVHDDMPCMDNDTLRRGKLTTHKKYGEAMGMLTGDALQAQAFYELTQTKLAGDQIAVLVKVLATAAGSAGMCGGQAVDLLSVHQKLDLDTLTLMHRLKTGAMIRASALMGLYAGEQLPPPALIGLIIQYADAIGLAFQVIDDILDVTADTAVLGKTAGKDAAEDKPTYVSILGLNQSRIMAQNEINRALEALKSIEELSEIYQGKTTRLEEIARYILSRDH
ncbi:MAG TPA: polyprenyl synthetase family protein [Candidatus Aphodousia faecavium]|uniref:Polyprenyl synthetase family protein n=1 Tax=Parasutterella secunda TaxID=626947 RepID=A0ABS2GUX8_9BURK|nr:farnesyl diphosphate synthase [Parasutterella secunda]MBM6929269.1 polyprenyl synthetase family protein [Parasutterella secunda]HIT96485.1 polyprenyl synthetase family protein [Candidatus Aphodousia faecavium]